VVRIITGEELEELLEPFGGVEASAERGRQYDADWKYVEAHREEFKKQYPDQWIGVLRKAVLAHAETAEEVLQTLDEAGVDVSVVVLHHACLEEPHWLLVTEPECLT
jgi:phosphoserine phosphatase